MHKMAAKQLHLDLDGIESSLYPITKGPLHINISNFVLLDNNLYQIKMFLCDR